MVDRNKLTCLNCGAQVEPKVVDVFPDYAIFAAVCSCGSLASGLKLRVPEAAARGREHLDQVLQMMREEYDGNVIGFLPGSGN